MTKEQLEQFRANYISEIRTSCAELLPKKLPILTEELFSIYEKTGNRQIYEKAYYERRKALAIIGLQAFLDLEENGGVLPNHLEKLCEVLSDICDEECWALPAHVYRKDNDNWRVTIDLFSCETAQTLAELTDRLEQYLPSELKKKIVSNVERRILIPYMYSDSSRGIEREEHNWNAVCCGSIGSACLHLMKDDPERLEKYLIRICEALPFYISGFSDDGACMEGLSYYNYGMSYFVNFAQELYEYSNGKWDLFCGEWKHTVKSDTDSYSAEKRLRMAHFYKKCFWEDGKTISFSDGSSNGYFRMGLLCLLSKHYPNVELSNACKAATLHDDAAYRFASLKMDFIYTKDLLSTLSEADSTNETKVEVSEDSFFYILPSAQWCIGNSKTGKTFLPTGVGFACKGGNNGEPHNHNDVGSFIYEANGELFFTDLGAGEYTRDYFNEKRYERLCTSSYGHNVPIISEQGQMPGTEYCATDFSASTDGHVRVEFSKTYASENLDELRRDFYFNTETGDLAITDTIKSSSVSWDFEENLITKIAPTINNNEVILESNGLKCILKIEQSAPVDVHVVEHEYSNHQCQKEKVYAIRWKVPITDNEETCSFSLSVIGNPT